MEAARRFPVGSVRTHSNLYLSVVGGRPGCRGGWGRCGVHPVRLPLLPNDENEPNCNQAGSLMRERLHLLFGASLGLGEDDELLLCACLRCG